jgi:hypothetical protein
MLTTALFTISKTWEQSKWPPKEEERKYYNTHSHKYSALKKKKDTGPGM